MPMPEPVRTLVLDTHVWLWLMEGANELKSSVRKHIEAAVPDGALLVSVISVWEIAMLEAKNRITFDEDCNVWVKNALTAPGFSLALFTPDVAVASTRLPGDFHGDPADRIIVATTRSVGGTLVTADRAILAYAKSGHLRALPA